MSREERRGKRGSKRGGGEARGEERVPRSKTKGTWEKKEMRESIEDERRKRTGGRGEGQGGCE